MRSLHFPFANRQDNERLILAMYVHSEGFFQVGAIVVLYPKS